MDCTAIPDDGKSLHTTPLPEAVFREVLSAIQICAKAPEGLDAGAVVLIDVTTYDSSRGEAPHMFLSRIMQLHPEANCFHVQGKEWFVAGLQALMLRCQRLEPNACLYVIDENFIRPAQWSYRYFWRYQAKHSPSGLSVADVGVLAREMTRMCDVQTD